jgi:hypothetical protein
MESEKEPLRADHIELIRRKIPENHNRNIPVKSEEVQHLIAR